VAPTATCVTAEPRHGLEILVGHNTVGKIMGELGIKGLPTGARVARVTSVDLVRRELGREGPNQPWMTDITEHPPRESKVHCSVVLDLFSRLVVGWSVESTQTTVLVTNTLGKATARRKRGESLVIHCDRSVQSASRALQAQGQRRPPRSFDRSGRQRLRLCDGRVLLGADAGRAVQPQTLEDPIELATAIHDYIELFHDTRPRHSGCSVPPNTRIYTTRPTRLIPESRLHQDWSRSESRWNLVRPRGLQYSVAQAEANPS
jgi:putative transposase